MSAIDRDADLVERIAERVNSTRDGVKWHWLREDIKNRRRADARIALAVIRESEATR